MRTYGSQNPPRYPPSSPPSTLSSSPPQTPVNAKKRPLQRSLSSLDNIELPPAKKPKVSADSNTNARKPMFLIGKASGTTKSSSHSKKGNAAASKQKTFTQLHFNIDQPLLRTCPLCQLSYTKGAFEDEQLHRLHCSRVTKGLEWGKVEERASAGTGVIREIDAGIRLKDPKLGKGKIICVKADAGGKIGKKLEILLDTVNKTLSAPPLTPETLRNSKAYLFLLPSSPDNKTTREKIVGCVIAQSIEHAMAIATPEESRDATNPPSDDDSGPRLVTVDAACGIFCYPELLPTPMGIPRLFVPSEYRRQGIASKLLNAAARTFVHGYTLDPRKGEAAFTQPTESGRAIMMQWGGGGVRIYEE